MSLPNLIIIGFPKSGTTSLFDYLSVNPQICSSDIKETQFFLNITPDFNLDDLDKYKEHFRHHSGEPIVMEGSPGYVFLDKKVIKRLKEIIGDFKIVIMLRNPTSRLFSYYKHIKRVGHIKEIGINQYIKELLNYKEEISNDNVFYRGLRGGYYYNYIKNWYDEFDVNQIQIVFFEDLLKNPKGLTLDLCNWLEIESNIYDQFTFGVSNKARPIKFVRLHRFLTQKRHFFESTLRKHRYTKKVLTKIYYFINKKDVKEELITTDVRSLIEEHYHSKNSLLREFLMSKGYTSFPNWMN